MKIFFLGISGTFMGNLAQIARELDHEVLGCDNKVYPPMSDELKSLGINFSEGYEESNFEEADLYIIGNAISKENKLLQKILDSNKNITSGPKWLHDNVLSKKTVIAISGTHGKTTVTSMISHALLENGINANYLIAGIPKTLKKSWNITSSELFVIEADEYDTCYFDKKPKFFHYNPSILLINNIEFDHADIYENIEMIEKNFLDLIESMPKESKILVNSHKVRESFKNSLSKLNVNAKIEFFELESFNISEENKQLACKALEGRLTTEQVLTSLDHYGGVKRRFETIYESPDFKVIDDFAHHPTAIEETLAMAKKENSNLELIIELGSNSMRKGIHDDRLIEILSGNSAYTINASLEQQNKFTGIAKELELQDLETICSKDNEKKTILMCGNRNFQGFQQLIIDKLIK
jgi:UDP-N-acetylmuramate: L-alanyl-gamma-D-glutamyl-meso-diaminopimelate ligase